MKKTMLLALSLLMAFALLGCAPKTPTPTPTPSTPIETPAPTPSAPVDAPTKINLTFLSGPTGVGGAKLMADSQAGTTKNQYTITVASANDEVVAQLTSGQADIAALATNLASTLYHKTDGNVQLAAINTLGVLYILERGDGNITELAQLKGKTLYATGQGANPEYVLRHLLTENGLNPDTDLDIQWKTAEEITGLMLSGQGDYCMLPVPAATALAAKSDGAIHTAISLSDQWDDLRNGSQLTMGAIVVRTAFAQEHPQAVADFLEEYAASIAYVSENVTDSAKLVAQYGLAPSEAIAAQAIPQCNLVCITGEDMRSAIQGYYEALSAADPASIGGSIPDDAFYFLVPNE